MMRVYARTREREKAWKFGALCLAGSTLAAPFVMMLLSVKEWSFTEVSLHLKADHRVFAKSIKNLWTFSVILESVCVLPQLLLLRQTTVPTVIDSFYLVTLGSYRAFYILNWILRAKHEIPRHMDFDFIAPIFGVIQTAFYIDFAWVYYARQRVKLRNGGIIDSEDLSRGWLVGKVMGRGVPELDEEDPLTVDGSNNGGLGRAQVKWAVPRGISVSADEELFQPRQKRRTRTHPATVIRGNEDAAMLEGNSEAEDSSDSITPPNGQQNTSIHDVGNGEEWRNESNK